MRFRALLLATLLTLSHGIAGQTLGVLHIKIVLLDAAQQPVPVSRHALLISDNPATAAPRRVVTAADGTANVRLRPGNYTVESDAPVAFDGKSYEWIQTIDVVAGQDATLELSASNAEAGAASDATPAARLEDAPSSLLTKWQASIVEVWTPTAHASGFVIDSGGLIATHQRAVGAATAVEVQISRSDKVAARVVAADAARDVAILRIDAQTAASMPAIPLDCAASPPPLLERQEVVALQAPLHQQKGAITGDVSRIRLTSIDSDLEPSAGGAGGPVFMTGGRVVGITTLPEAGADGVQDDARIVRIGEVCAVVARAQQSLGTSPAPASTRLPVDPVRAMPVDLLKERTERGGTSVRPYQFSSSDFDLALMTPLQMYAAQGLPPDMFAPERRDFANWSDYVAALPSVLLVRVSPQFEEGFWAKVGRAAASTQGVALPPLKRFSAVFSRLRAFCGDKELAPIHAFIIEQRVTEKQVINEGLYAFDPGAFAPACSALTLQLYSEKSGDKPETVMVDRKVVQQIWDDFAPFRDIK